MHKDTPIIVLDQVEDRTVDLMLGRHWERAARRLVRRRPQLTPQRDGDFARLAAALAAADDRGDPLRLRRPGQFARKGAALGVHTRLGLLSDWRDACRRMRHG